jgi:hypothetical protein
VRAARWSAGQGRGASDGRHGAVHGHELHMRVRRGTAGAEQAHGPGGAQARGRGKEGKREGRRGKLKEERKEKGKREEKEREKRKRKGEKRIGGKWERGEKVKKEW